MIKVRTRNATYLIDRDNFRWMRLSDFDLHEFDNTWVKGGFTLGEIGSFGFAHFADHPEEISGRYTSTITDIWYGVDE